MNRRLRITSIVLTVLAALALAAPAACAPGPTTQQRETVTQISTIDALMNGVLGAVTFFDNDQSVPLPAGTTFKDFQAMLDKALPSVNEFEAIRVSGAFSYMKTRSIPAQKKPYPGLGEAAKTQPEFELKEVKGTIAGFRLPPFVSGLNVTGYHLHFITDDLTGGGHILDFTVKNATVTVDHTPNFFMVLPGPDSPFYKVDLSKDLSGEVGKAEK